MAVPSGACEACAGTANEIAASAKSSAMQKVPARRIVMEQSVLARAAIFFQIPELRLAAEASDEERR